jgi:hypothetical protein
MRHWSWFSEMVYKKNLERPEQNLYYNELMAGIGMLGLELQNPTVRTRMQEVVSCSVTVSKIH